LAGVNCSDALFANHSDCATPIPTPQPTPSPTPKPEAATFLKLDNSSRLILEGECGAWKLQENTQKTSVFFRNCTDAPADVVNLWLRKHPHDQADLRKPRTDDNYPVNNSDGSRQNEWVYPCKWGFDDGRCDRDAVFRELCAFTCYPVSNASVGADFYWSQEVTEFWGNGDLYTSCRAEDGDNNRGFAAMAGEGGCSTRTSTSSRPRTTRTAAPAGSCARG
jgi:hypothetical protein